MRSRFIETVSPQKNGTKLKYGGKVYQFVQNELGAHVVEVIDDQHYDAILSIGAGYRPYSNDSAARAEAAIQARVDADVAVRKASVTKVNPLAKANAAKAEKRAQQEAEG